MDAEAVVAIESVGVDSLSWSEFVFELLLLLLFRLRLLVLFPLSDLNLGVFLLENKLELKILNII